MDRLPKLSHKHKICVICEGFEDYYYFARLLELNLWNDAYEFVAHNAKSASNIPARFQDDYQNDRYEVVLIFCDTDKAPYKEYTKVKEKINHFLNKKKAAEMLTIYANPCTMQIILSHFGVVSLKNQGKKTNAAVIEKWTGVKDYDAHEKQIKAICNQIYKRSYQDMRDRVTEINFPDTESGSTNFIDFLKRFESEDTKWISEIQNYLRK